MILKGCGQMGLRRVAYPRCNRVNYESPFTTNNQASPHEPFIDAHTGKIYQGIEYWQTLGDILNKYINHPEHKLDGDIGLMQKKHLHITNIARCGKETRNLDTQILNLDLPESQIDDKTLKNIILNMNPKERRQKGISRQTLQQLKRRATNTEPLLLTEKIRRKIV